MKRKMLSLLLAVSMLILQANISIAATPAFTNTQSGTPTVTGNGIFIEAENCSYTSWYTKASNSSASGNYVLKAASSSKDPRSKSTRGDFEVKFKAEKAGTYIVWVRAYATSDSQDSFFSGFLNQGYETTEIKTYNDFIWINSGSITLSAGASATFVASPRESGHLIDGVVITSTGFIPSGKTIVIPTGEIENVISSNYAPTPYQPPAEHPRVMFRTSDIQRIKTNMTKPQNKGAYDRFIDLKSSSPTGDAKGGYNERMLREIESRAFDYAINGNKTSGQMAVSAIMKYLSTADPSKSGNETRNGGNIMYMASEVYDWCYDLMTDAQRKTVISTCEKYAGNMEIKWPPDSQGSVVGHGSEAQLLRDMLAFAIATYDERPDIWESVGGRFYEEYTDARNYFNKGHYALQGDSYGLYRHRWDTYSYLLIKGMGLPTNYNEEDLAQVGYSQIYLRRPDGQYMRDGDSSDDTTYSLWEYWSGYAQTYIVDSAIANDPYLKDEAFTMNISGEACYYSSPIVFLVANNPDLPKASVRNLPKSRFFDDPAGVMVARTGWDKGADTNDVVVEMKIGGVRQNNHQHYDAGHFQIYYKGILASDSGVYQGLYNDHSSVGGTDYNSTHRQKYMIRTIAHNSMLIYNPADGTDGGQRFANNNSEPSKITSILNNENEYRAASVLAEEIDPKHPIDPEYTYIKGDLSNGYTNRASEFKRSFMFLNLFEEEVPAALIVFDKVVSTNQSFKKTWLLHGVEKPTVNGMQTVFSRKSKSSVVPVGYNGKMTVDTLLPKASDANIEIVGGEKDGFSLVNGVDMTGIPSPAPTDEGNTYRMELSPKSQNLTDHFLNVIQVSDNDKNYYADTEFIENSLFYGAKIRNRAVLFSKSGKNVGSEFSITVPSTYKFTVCDAKPGTWQVKTDEGKNKVIVGAGGVLAFEASGTITCTYLSSIGEQIITPVVLSTDDECRMKIDGQYVNGKELPELKNSTLMMSLTTFSDWFRVNTEYENDSVLIFKGDKSLQIKAGEKEAILNGSPFSLQEAPYVKNGELMIPTSDFVEEFGGTFTWHTITKIAEITRPVDCSLPDGYATMVGVKRDAGAIDGDNIAENAIDENIDTIWAANGVGRYFDIDLGRRQEIDQVEILFNPNSNRNAKFEILVSNDGKNFTSVLSSTSDGSLESVMWEIFPLDKPVSARYVRYKGNGSNISNWNAIKEIRFRRFDDSVENPSPEENIQVLYSVTGNNFASIASMKDTQTEYEVILPDNSKYVYLEFAVPQGCSKPDTVRYGWTAKNANGWFDGLDKKLLGTEDYDGTSIDSHVLYQTQIPMKASATGEIFKVPIKNECSEVTFTYTDENGTEREYYIDFRAKQPRLTSFTNVLSGSSGKAIFVGGAAVNNDNGSIIHSGVKNNTGINAMGINAMGNISEELLGGSMFMLPARTTNSSVNLFTFTADHGGKIYVLSDTQITGTGYSSGWTRENNGTMPQGMQTGTSVTTSRETNSSSVIYALSVNWRADTNSSDYSSGTKNYYRASTPGVSGKLTSTHITNSYGMKYAYSKTFSAGESVTVPGTGNLSIDTAVIIKWNDDNILDELSYSAFAAKGKVSVNANSFDSNSTVFSALYDNYGRLIALKASNCNSENIDFQMSKQLFKTAKQLKLFVWDLASLTPYSNRVYNIN